MIETTAGKRAGASILMMALLIALLGTVARSQDNIPEDIPEIGTEADEEEPANLPKPTFWDNIHLNGKFDATFDVAQKDHVRAQREGAGSHTIANWDNYHSFLFLNAVVTPNLTFFGTMYVGTRTQHFFYAERKLTREMKLKFGRILVPFGANPFHSFYGGVGGYQYETKMIPNIWAEPGIGIHYRTTVSSGLEIEGDTYFVKRSVYSEPDVVLSRAGSAHSAIGQWLKFVVAKYSTVWASAFYDTYYETPANSLVEEERDELLFALDVKHDFGWTGIPFVSTTELSAGFARLNRATLDHPDGEAFDFDDFRGHHYGDYVQLAFQEWDRWIQPRVRYGTFANDPTADPEVEREHHLVFSVLVPDGNMSYLIQYQRNWEDLRPGAGASQRDDDLFRLQFLFEF